MYTKMESYFSRFEWHERSNEGDDGGEVNSEQRKGTKARKEVGIQPRVALLIELLSA